MEQPVNPNRNVFAVKNFLKEYLDLRKDKDNELATVDSIRKGVEFKGANLWILIFAIFMASLGLNVNSTAVIIGAMLISPLMGPIMGVGLSVGLNDFELMKRSLKSFLITTLFSVTTATVFFLVSPVAEGQSELLARTSPTIYDVFIALMGGLAGVVALSTKEKGNVIPGVAIATALMPPLCTAGFGLATLQFKYFIGAFYLFFINTVFIAIATFIVVRFLHYSKKEFVDKNREMRVRRSILLIVLVTIIPSVVIGYRIVKRSLFENDVKRYVNTVFQFPKTKVIEHTGIYRPDNGESYVEIYLIGEPISDEMIENARLQMPQYNLRDVRLVVRQSGETDNLNFSTLQTGYQELLSEKNIRIRELETKLSAFATDTLAVRDITVEMRTLVPDLHDVTLSKAVRYNTDKTPADTLVLCVMHLNKGKKLAAGERERIEQWLRVRTKTDSLKLYTE